MRTSIARAIPLVTLLGLGGIVASGCGSTTRQFDSSDWKGNHHRAEMIGDLRGRVLKLGVAKSALYPMLGWPEEVSGTDYDYSRRWSWCIKTEEQDAFMSHAPCISELDIYFAAPTYKRISAVRIVRVPT
jgi:hypothetical protein